ncbi:hypothetical protein TURU_096532 [Turdus rufiventris]|nr:hypothetical protein TURU_096532 [Turdus rufiventris]
MEKQLPCNHKHEMWQKQDSGPQKTNFQCLDSLLVCELLNGPSRELDSSLMYEQDVLTELESMKKMMKELAAKVEKSDFLQSDFSEAEETPVFLQGSMPISQPSSHSALQALQRGFCIPGKVKLHDCVSCRAHQVAHIMFASSLVPVADQDTAKCHHHDEDIPNIFIRLVLHPMR